MQSSCSDHQNATQMTASFQALRDGQVLFPNVLGHNPMSRALSHHVRNPSLPRRETTRSGKGSGRALLQTEQPPGLLNTRD